MAIPASWVMFCKGVNLRDTSGDYDTMYFADNTARFNYMNGKAITVNPSGATATEKKRLSNQAYQRIDNGSIKVSLPYETLFGCDYMVLYNGAGIEPGSTFNYEHKHIYCFIDSIKYINDGVTQVNFHVDLFQTWINDVTLQSSYIKREITSSDDRFSVSNMTPDYFNNAPLKTMYKHDVDATNCQGLYLVCALTQALAVTNTPREVVIMSPTSWTPQSITGGMYDPLCYYITKLNKTTHETAEEYFTEITRTIMNDPNKKDSIVGMYIAPEICVPPGVVAYIASTSGQSNPVLLCPGATADWNIPSSTSGWLNTQLMFKDETYSSKSNNIAYSNVVTKTFTFSNTAAYLFGDGNDGHATPYSPKNQKLYNAPYTMFVIKNNMGQSVEIPVQNMVRNIPGGSDIYDITMRGIPALCPQVLIDLPVETEYENTDYRISIDNYPTITSTASAYERMRNQMLLTSPFLMAKFAIGQVAPLAASAATGSILPYAVSQVASGAGIAVEKAEQLNVAEQSGNQINGISNGDLTAQATNNFKFTIEVKSIAYADAKTIDTYFTKYGYNISSIGTPYYGLNSRPVFGYCQTANAGVTGDAPAEAKNRIAQIYNDGVRIWTPAHYLDYSQDNSVTQG